MLARRLVPATLSMVALSVVTACSAPPASSGPASPHPPAVPSPAAAAASARLTSCTGGSFRLRQLGTGGPAGGSDYQILAVDSARSPGCAIRRLAVFYLDASTHRIGHASVTPGRLLDERTARLVTAVPVRAGHVVYLRVATPEPAGFGPPGCGQRQAAHEAITVNTAQLWLPTRLVVCGSTAGRPSVTVASHLAPPHGTTVLTARQR